MKRLVELQVAGYYTSCAICGESIKDGTWYLILMLLNESEVLQIQPWYDMCLKCGTAVYRAVRKEQAHIELYGDDDE